jgi:hypothetical protein
MDEHAAQDVLEGSFCRCLAVGPVKRGHKDAVGSYGDDKFSPTGLFLFQVADGVGSLARRLDPVDDRCDLPGLERLPLDGQIVCVLASQEDSRPLAHHR